MVALSLIAIVALLLAFANGANDNGKGVATVIGTRTLAMKPALVLAAIATLVGSVAAIFFAGELVARFGGKGIVGDDLAATQAFAVCVGLAAAATVLAATRLGMPISTTHAMVGAIVGIGVAAGDLFWAKVLGVFLLPLLLSPLIALAGAVVVYVLFRWGRRRLGVTHRTCICLNKRYEPVSIASDGAMTLEATGVTLEADDVDACLQKYDGQVAGVSAQRVLDGSHLLTAAALSFARGLNDTPKIAAIMLAAGGLAIGPAAALVMIGVGIAAGGLLAVRRVAKTMSYDITGMNDGQGFSANLVSSVLVCLATLRFGVPVSTTHTSCGSLFGIGLVNRRAHWPMIGRVVGAWVTTLPVAGLLGYLMWLAVSG